MSLIALLFFSGNIYANSYGYECHILLSGELVLSDRVALEEPKNEKECEEAALKLFKENKLHYKEAFIKTAKGFKEVQL